MTTTNKKGSQQFKKYVVFTLMAAVCAAAIWFIFAPSDADKAKQEQGQGLNSELPDPRKDGIISDKRDAYEQESLRQKQQERMRSLQEYDFSSGENTPDYNDERYVKMAPVPVDYDGGESRNTSARQSSINGSATAYRDLNRSLGSFYETPKEDNEREELMQKVEQLQAQLDEGSNRQASIDEQVALMEKSYELAARYLPQNDKNAPFGQPQQPAITTSDKPTSAISSNGKTRVTPVEQIRSQVASTLSQPTSDSAFVADYSQERNIGFHTVSAQAVKVSKNTISAVVHGTQTIADGQAVRLRLTEPIKAGDVVVPENTVVTGVGKIVGERLEILLTSVEYGGKVLTVELFVYDSDGQRGIFIPSSMEQSAIKEIAANMGGSLGSTISLSQQSAGEQLLTDLGRGAIQGTSQYLSKKLRQIKVTLKAGYRLMLLPNEQ